jgi:phosphopantothenoylcysteine synthetase/decarboxylase
MRGRRTLGLVGCAAGGVENLRCALVEPLVADGWRVTVTLTPHAARWLQELGEVERLTALTGFAVRWAPRSPGEAAQHPAVDGYAVVPATANTVAKLALGIADNQALTAVGEAVGSRLPVVVFPRVNAAHARQVSWASHLAGLRAAGVHLVYGEGVWPLHEPRSAPGRDLPWATIRQVIEQVVPQGPGT